MPMDPDRFSVVTFSIGDQRGIGVWYWPTEMGFGTEPSKSYRIFWI